MSEQNEVAEITIQQTPPDTTEEIKIEPLQSIQLSKCQGTTIKNGKKRKCRNKCTDQYCPVHISTPEVDLDKHEPKFTKEVAAALLFEYQIALTQLTDIVQTERYGFPGLRERFLQKEEIYKKLWEGTYEEYGDTTFDYVLNPITGLLAVISTDLALSLREHRKKTLSDE